MTMIKQLENWTGKVCVNGVEYGSVGEMPTIPLDGSTVITLMPNKVREKAVLQEVTDDRERVFTVRQWMTRVDNNPMPMRTMVGRVEKQTQKAVYLKLHGQALPVITCMRCGRTLTNPISRHYGLGIECINKVGLGFLAEATDVDKIKEALVDVRWEGWLPKSAIESDEVFNAG